MNYCVHRQKRHKIDEKNWRTSANVVSIGKKIKKWRILANVVSTGEKAGEGYFLLWGWWWCYGGAQVNNPVIFSILQHGFNPHTFILTQSNIMPWTPAPVWSSWTARQPKICDAAEQLEEDFPKKVSLFLRILHNGVMANIGAIVRMSFSLYTVHKAFYKCSDPVNVCKTTQNWPIDKICTKWRQ